MFTKPEQQVSLRGAGTRWRISPIGLDASAGVDKYKGFTVGVRQGAMRRQELALVSLKVWVVSGAAGNVNSMLIGSSEASVGSDVIVHAATGIGAGGFFSIGATDTWELRWINQIIGGTGGTLIPPMNGGSVHNSGSPANDGMPAFIVPKTIDGVPRFQYWSDQTRRRRLAMVECLSHNAWNGHLENPSHVNWQRS